MARLRPSEPAILVHTSGTTGRPKLVPLTHQQLITAVVFMKLEVPEAVPGARHLSALPLFHVAGLANLSYTLFTGGHLHLLAGFDPAGFVDELVRRRIQLTQLVPTLIHAVTQEVSSRAEPPDLSHLIEVVYGASPIRPELLERAVAVLGCRFRQNYASSETGPLPITSLPPEDHDPARGRLGTAGRPSLGWEVRLGERGEIQVRGAAPLPGYWNDPEATARSLTADGFYRTGDVGTLGADGYLTIVDRLSDLVITGGENVYPAEVEAVLAGHPAVADVAVIGVPDERWGETVHAVVVLAPGLPGRDTAPGRANGDAEPGFDAAALVGWARERLAGFKCPTGVTVVSELPRNATGKVLRAALREPFWTGRDRLGVMTPARPTVRGRRRPPARAGRPTRPSARRPGSCSPATATSTPRSATSPRRPAGRSRPSTTTTTPRRICSSRWPRNSTPKSPAGRPAVPGRAVRRGGAARGRGRASGAPTPSGAAS